VVVNPQETAENLKKYGAYIPSIRPGSHTAEYIHTIIMRLTFIGALYLALICIIPEILIANFSLPFYLGGTGLLIVVNVTIDMITQVQSHLYSQQYETLIKKYKLKGARA
jgi:preprotein translocase subunit SecY